MKRESFSVALIVAAALLAGCGGADDAADTAATTAPARPSYAGKPSPKFPRQLRVSLDGQMNAADIAILMAVERGFFTDVGLTVYPGIPVWPRRPVRYVAAYTDDLAVTQQPQVALGKESGAPIVAVGSLISQSTAAMIWLKESGVEEIADLKNKKIGVPGIPYQEKMLEFVLDGAGLEPGDVDVSRVGYRLLPALLGGRVDAIFGGSWNIEGAALRARGAEPVIKRVQGLGVPSYDELVIITRADRAAREPEVVRKFMSAVSRGVAAVKRHPAIAAELVESSPHEFVPTKSETMAQVRATLPLLSRTGYLDPDQAEELTSWMHDEGMLQEQPPISELFTNRYLTDGG